MNIRPYPFLALSLGLAACVTVNVYFPAAAAEQAVDGFVKDVYGNTNAEDADTSDTPGDGDQGLNFDPKQEKDSDVIASLWELLVPAAHAQQPDINIATPAINKLKASMKDRHTRLKPYYDSGAVGMTNKALLAIRDAKAIGLKERNQVKALVSHENRDRETLYRTIANANGHPEWEQQIRTIFARRWIGNAPAGWWHQNEAGVWEPK